MPASRRALARLRQHYDPQALCYGLQQIILEQGQPCAHDFTYTRSILARYAPDVDIETLITALEGAGAHCDCEVVYNVCPLVYA